MLNVVTESGEIVQVSVDGFIGFKRETDGRFQVRLDKDGRRGILVRKHEIETNNIPLANCHETTAYEQYR